MPVCVQDTVIAVARGGNRLRLNNMASAHGEQDFGLDPAQVSALRPNPPQFAYPVACECTNGMFGILLKAAWVVLLRYGGGRPVASPFAHVLCPPRFMTESVPARGQHSACSCLLGALVPVTPGRMGTVTNTAGATPSRECCVGLFHARQEVDRDNHSWGNYVMCAYKGVHKHLASAGRPAPELVGLQLLVDGRVPQGALLQGIIGVTCSPCSPASVLLNEYPAAEGPLGTPVLRKRVLCHSWFKRRVGFVHRPCPLHLFGNVTRSALQLLSCLLSSQPSSTLTCPATAL